MLYPVLGPSQVEALLKKYDTLEGVNIHFNKELGRGSYAAVYQAEWRGLSCVAKVFHAVIFPNSAAETWKQLAREIELLQNIRHPNIVQLLGFIPETNSRIPSIVMEQLNTNLTSLIKDHHSLLLFDIQVCILHDVAVGLSFLHGHKEPIVHRDLSSNNILLTDHLVAKISDLGLAKHIKSSEQQVGSYTGFGTQDYMPPEVLGQRPPQISPKTDVFSFGVVMLQIAVERSPDIRGVLNVDAEADRRKHHLDLLSESNLLHPLVLQCLCNKSYDHPTTVVLCEALKKIGVNRKSTLKLTEAFQEEKVGLKKQLEALQLQKDSDIQNMKKVQEQLQQEMIVLQTRLDEEKKAAVLIKADLDNALNSKNKLKEKLLMENEAQNKLHAAVVDLHKTSLELQQTRAQLAIENEVAEMIDKNEKTLMVLQTTVTQEQTTPTYTSGWPKQWHLREAATQSTKYQHAVEEIKQLKRDN